MRILRNLLFMIVGGVLLVAAAAVLWTAHGPQATGKVTTGGVSFTQQDLAEGEPVTAMIEQGLAVPMEVELSAAAQSDLASLDSDESARLPETTDTVAPGGVTSFSTMSESGETVNLTSDVVLDSDSAVTVAPVSAAFSSSSDGQGGSASSAVGYEQRVVELEWPSEFQVGRASTLRIKLKMLSSGALQPVAEIADNEILATPILIDATQYATYDAYVQAVVSAPDFSVSTTNLAPQKLEPGGEVEWRYTLKSSNSRSAVILVGLNLSWNSKVAGGKPGPQNVAIFGQTLQVEVNYVFGLITVPQASIAGTGLAIIGFLAEAPLLSTILETVWEIVFGGDRRKRRREREKEEKRRRKNRRR